MRNKFVCLIGPGIGADGAESFSVDADQAWTKPGRPERAAAIFCRHAKITGKGRADAKWS